MVYINSFNLNVAIHCFGTMLKVLKQVSVLALQLARSQSRLGLVSEGLIYIPATYHSK